MRNILHLLWKIVSAPFRAIGWLVKQIFGWFSSIISDIKRFFVEEPEDSPIADTLSKTVEAPEELFTHLNDLRKNLTRAVIVFGLATVFAFIFSSQILEILSMPLPDGVDGLIAIDVTEPISTLMRISLLTGFAIAMPYIIFELFRFVAPGISVNARVWGCLGIPIVVIFFLGGMAFAYFVMLPPSLDFLTGILGIQTQIRPSSYIGFVTSIMFWVGISFQFPLVIFVLAGMGLVSSKTLSQQWRLAIVIIAIVSALITPTIDPMNMALIMGPLIALYFLSILLAMIAQRGRA